MRILRGFNSSPAVDKSEKPREGSAGDVCFLFCAKQKAAAFSGIIGLPDRYGRRDETVMEFVVDGSGDIFSVSPAP